MDPKEITKRFSNHNVAPGDPALVRNACLELAMVLNDIVPESREKSLAMTNLEQAMFWANAGIARSQA